LINDFVRSGANCISVPLRPNRDQTLSICSCAALPQAAGQSRSTTFEDEDKLFNGG
jgi:hypothetical protein